MKLAHILAGRPVPKGTWMVSAVGGLSLRQNAIDHLVEVFLTSPAGFLSEEFQSIKVPAAALGAFRIGSRWEDGEYRGQTRLSDQKTITLMSCSGTAKAGKFVRLFARHHWLPKSVYRDGWFSEAQGSLDGRPVTVVTPCPTLLTSVFAPSPEVLMALLSAVDSLPWTRRFWIDKELSGLRRSELRGGVLKLCLSKWVDNEGCRPLVWWFLEEKARAAAMDIERSIHRAAAAKKILAPLDFGVSHARVRLPFSRPCKIRCRGQLEGDLFLVQSIEACDYVPADLQRLELERENPGAQPESIYQFIDQLRSGSFSAPFGSASNPWARLGDRSPYRWQLPKEWRLPSATELMPGLEIEWPKRRARENDESLGKPRIDTLPHDEVGIGNPSSGAEAVPPLKLQFTLPEALDDELAAIGNMVGFTFFVAVLAELGNLGFHVSPPDCGYLGELAFKEEAAGPQLPPVLVAQVRRGEGVGFVCEVQHPEKLVRARTASMTALRLEPSADPSELTQLVRDADFRAQVASAAGGKRWRIKTVRHLFKPLQADPQFKAVRVHALKLERAFKQLWHPGNQAAG